MRNESAPLLNHANISCMDIVREATNVGAGTNRQPMVSPPVLTMRFSRMRVSYYRFTLNSMMYSIYHGIAHPRHCSYLSRGRQTRHTQSTVPFEPGRSNSGSMHNITDPTLSRLLVRVSQSSSFSSFMPGSHVVKIMVQQKFALSVSIPPRFVSSVAGLKTTENRPYAHLVSPERCPARIFEPHRNEVRSH